MVELNLKESNIEKEYYSRQIMLPHIGEKGQKKLKKAKVLVAGAGGLGCPALLYLVRAGVGNICIVDNETVEVSNLNRQVLFGINDVGRKKAEVAAEILRNHNPSIQIKEICKRLNAKNIFRILKDYDIILDGTDNMASRYLINDTCEKLKIPFVYGAVFKMEGYVSVFLNHQSNQKQVFSFRDLYPNSHANLSIKDCNVSGVLGIVTGVVGTIQANEVIKLILGNNNTLHGKLLNINLENFKLKIFNLTPNINKNNNKNDDYYDNSYSSLIKMNELSVNQLREVLQSKKEIQIIDIRHENTYSSITQNDIKIPFNQLTNRVNEIHKTNPVIIYCQKGIMSSKAIELLKNKFEYKNILHLRGGIDAWIKYNEKSIGN